MNTATPDDETTTAAGDGWSEDMELAPAHPGDAAVPEHDDERQGERLQKVRPAPASVPAVSART